MRKLVLALAAAAPALLLIGWKSFVLPPTRTLVLESGVVDLPAYTIHENARIPLPSTTVVREGGWLHGFRIELVDAHGRTVKSDLLHHVKVMNLAQRELFNPIMLRVVGAGSETKPVELPRALGYPLNRGDTLLVTAMLHNTSGVDYHGVRVRVMGQYTPRMAPPEPEPVYPFFAHVTEPDSSSSYDLPPGWSERSRLVRPAIEGRVIGLGGHMHKYGVRLILEDVTAGDTLWTSDTVRDSDGNVLEVPTRQFFWRGGMRLRPDHVYRVTGVYFNPTNGTLHDAGMATIGGALQPAPGTRWPAVNRSDPVYQYDIAAEMSANGHNHGSSSNARPDNSKAGHSGHH